jgi:hypothetical protein
MSEPKCEICKFCLRETDRHGESSYECGRFPPTIVNSTSLSKFPKILPHWSCGEFKISEYGQ